MRRRRTQIVCSFCVWTGPWHPTARTYGKCSKGRTISVFICTDRNPNLSTLLEDALGSSVNTFPAGKFQQLTIFSLSQEWSHRILAKPSTSRLTHLFRIAVHKILELKQAVIRRHISEMRRVGCEGGNLCQWRHNSSLIRAGKVGDGVGRSCPQIPGWHIRHNQERD